MMTVFRFLLPKLQASRQN